MKVLHLSAASELTGAGKATLLTHNALLNKGIKSRVLFLKSNINVPEVYSYHKISTIAKFIRLTTTFIDKLPLTLYPKKTHSIFSPGLVGLNLKHDKLIKWADIIHIHWANHGFIDIQEIPKWNKPVVWTLRDMWAFTGGCHHAFECENFKNRCGNCPALGSNIETDLSSYVLKRKLKYLRNLNVTWVAISSWIQRMANESVLLKERLVEVIHSGVDANLFTVLKKNLVRTKLKLPIDKIIILIGAANIRERYKGFEYAKGLLNKISPDFLVITFGSGYFLDGEIQQQSIHFGEVNNEQLKEIYNAADVFLGPSIAEAMGKTFLEAQLCGLPVVCFDETGPADIVKHKETGYLAKYKNADDLLTGLEFCLNTKMNREAIRSRAFKSFDINQVVEKYIGIYEKSIVDWANSSLR